MVLITVFLLEEMGSNLNTFQTHMFDMIHRQTTIMNVEQD